MKRLIASIFVGCMTSTLAEARPSSEYLAPTNQADRRLSDPTVPSARWNPRTTDWSRPLTIGDWGFNRPGYPQGLFIHGITVKAGESMANPVIYDNDVYDDVFDDELAMVMASLGEMNLQGLIVTPVLTDGWGFSKPDWIKTAHQARSIAAQSGLDMSRIPPITVGTEAASERQGEAKDSAGARLYIRLIQEQFARDPQRPLIVNIGGQGATLASAFCLDPSIAQRCIVYYTDLRVYNGHYRWASELVAKHFRVVSWGDDYWWITKPAQSQWRVLPRPDKAEGKDNHANSGEWHLFTRMQVSLLDDMVKQFQTRGEYCQGEQKGDGYLDGTFLHAWLPAIFSEAALQTIRGSQVLHITGFTEENERRVKSFALERLLNTKAYGREEAVAPGKEFQARGGLPNFLNKLDSAQDVTIAYLGGSITAQEGWRPRTQAWLRQQFPKAKIGEINAAIGGTGSDLGVFRLGHDVLRGHPDLVFIEFAVNDAGAAREQIHRCMEGIVRQIWHRDPATDICFVYTLAGNMLDTYLRGELPRSVQAMEQIADHYRIPTINLGVEIARLEKAGKLIFKGDLPKTDADKDTLGHRIVFSPDAVHPYPETGHRIYGETVARAMDVIFKAGRPGAHSIPSAFVPDNWESAKMIPLSQAALSADWRRLDPAQDMMAKRFGNRLPELWMARQPGESLSFRFRGSAARIYDLLGPDCGQVTVQVDSQPAVTRPRFDAYCTYHRLATLTVAERLTNTIHQVRLTIHPDQPDKAKILSQRNEKMDDPKRYDGTAWYAGAILLLGDMVK